MKTDKYVAKGSEIAYEIVAEYKREQFFKRFMKKKKELDKRKKEKENNG